MLVLELFAGTGSVGKNVKKKGYKVLSVDSDEKTNSDIITDILKWDYKKLNIKPDVIWASPPCGTFTNMALTNRKKSTHPARVRNATTMKPILPAAVIGDKILSKTIEIINYYKKINPRLKFIMENPHGSMWRSPLMKKLGKYGTTKTLYCLYSDKRRKPTDFFNNFGLELKEGNCKAIVGVLDVPLCERYKIPQKLLDDVFRQMKLNKII